MNRFVWMITGGLLLASCVAIGSAEPDDSIRTDAPPALSMSSMEVAETNPTRETTLAALSEVPVSAVPVGLTDPRPVQGQPFSYPTRTAITQGWTAFARIRDVVLHHPSDVVETIGFHESSHDGAQQMELLDAAVAPFTMSSRERGNASRTAADIVVDPSHEIRSPVTGTVLRAGSYTLYCEHRDDFAVIEPDDRPGWEVKILHMVDVAVSSGERVEAGVTVIADGPRTLPFRSQVDDATSGPSWGHVHVEVVDPSIPDRPGLGC